MLKAGLAGRSERDETARSALRVVLGLPKSAPVAAMFIITGQLPVFALDLQTLLIDWMRLPGQPKEVRDVREVLRRDYLAGKDLGNQEAVVHWLLKELAGEEGDRIWREQERKWSVTGIKLRIRRMVEEALQADIAEMMRMTFFRSSGIECEPSRALELKDGVDRRNMLKLLMSVHTLAIETGRHDGRPLHERTCCWDPDEVEDERHFLFKCRCNVKEREDLERRLEWTGRGWNMETWVWMFTQDGVRFEEEEKQKRAAVRLAAAFITKSLARREHGPMTEPQLSASSRVMEVVQEEEEGETSYEGNDDSSEDDSEDEEEEFVDAWYEDETGDIDIDE